MKIVGITGGIGSGKTTAARMFGLLGGMIYYSDIHSRRIINDTPQVKQAIIDYYGEVFDESGNINGTMLADIVFNDAVKLAYLNNLMFPYIMKDFKEFCEIWNDSEYCMIESAILVDCGADKLVDFVINVSCPEDVRIQRAMARDGRTKDQVIAKINNQAQEDVRMNAADWVIWNSGTDTEYLQQQVNQVHKELVAK